MIAEEKGKSKQQERIRRRRMEKVWTEYIYTVVKEDWNTGKRAKRTRRYYAFKPALQVGGLYLHLGRGFSGAYRVLSVKERQVSC